MRLLVFALVLTVGCTAAQIADTKERLTTPDPETGISTRDKIEAAVYQGSWIAKTLAPQYAPFIDLFQGIAAAAGTAWLGKKQYDRMKASGPGSLTKTTAVMEAEKS